MHRLRLPLGSWSMAASHVPRPVFSSARRHGLVHEARSNNDTVSSLNLVLAFSHEASDGGAVPGCGTWCTYSHPAALHVQWGSPSASDPRAKNTGQRATKATVLTSQSLSPCTLRAQDSSRLRIQSLQYRSQGPLGKDYFRTTIFFPANFVTLLAVI